MKPGRDSIVLIFLLGSPILVFLVVLPVFMLRSFIGRLIGLDSP